ncbi:MAG TPA: methylamine utilization protein [Lacunisphaera sp.]
MRSRLLFALLVLTAATRVAAASTTLTGTVRDNKGAFVSDAVVSLIPLDQPAPPPAEPPGEIAQQTQEFLPYVTVVQAGTKVVFPNRDTVQHHVYSLSKAKKFELPLYNPGQKESLVFESTGLVTLGCNIHDWMIAYLLVVPTPYFAKTDEQGRATVTAPAGRYRVEVWHPRVSAALTQEIALTAGEASARDFGLTLKPDRRIRRGGATKTGGYR